MKSNVMSDGPSLLSATAQKLHMRSYLLIPIVTCNMDDDSQQKGTNNETNKSKLRKIITIRWDKF